MQQVAIVGSGIAGLGAAHFLQRDFELTVFEAGAHVGGHTHTVVVAGGEEWIVSHYLMEKR